jgi:hypothetical protein
MPCYQQVRRRARAKMRVELPDDASITDEDIQKALGVDTHEKAHAKLDAMSDEEFKRLVEYIQWKIKRKSKPEEVQSYIS